MEVMTLTAPPGVRSGQEMSFRTIDGRVFKIVVPAGVAPGGSFQLQIPRAAVTAAPSAPPPAPPVGQVPMGLPITESSRNVLGAPTSTAYHTPQSDVAIRHAECAITFEPLHKAPVGVFLDASGARVSPHFFNLEAAREWLASGNGMCPLTRQPVASVAIVPSITADPDGWFKVVDIDGDGKLSRKEAIEALKAQLPTDNNTLDAAVNDPTHWMWQQWDVDGSGYIERNELLAPQGLVSFVQAQAATTAVAAVPDMSDKARWYAYWDEDGSGTLEKEEVVRALLKTLRLTTDPARIQMMRGTIEAIWPVFDTDGSGSIERDEFLRPGEGLADTIVATLQFG